MLLLFWFSPRTTGARGASALVAALFAVHPLHVESVAWISERKDVLSTLFWMLTIGVRPIRARATARSLMLMRGLFALGLMAKPMLVTLPFVLLLLDSWPLGRIVIVHGVRRPARRAIGASWPLVREKLPLFALAAAASVATVSLSGGRRIFVRLEVIPFGLRIKTAILSYARM